MASWQHFPRRSVTSLEAFGETNTEIPDNLKDNITLVDSAYETGQLLQHEAARAIHWSTYHTYAYVRDGKHLKDPKAPIPLPDPESGDEGPVKVSTHIVDMPRVEPPKWVAPPLHERIWNEIYPFATCVGYASKLVNDIREAYRHSSYDVLKPFADRVKLLASYEADGKPRHCVGALFLRLPPEERFIWGLDLVIVFDVVLDVNPFIINLSSHHATPPFYDFHGEKHFRIFRYEAIRGGGPHVLTMEFPTRDGLGNPATRVRFREISAADAVRLITIPTAKMNVDTEYELEGGLVVRGSLPTKKAITTRIVIKEKPFFVDGVELRKSGIGMKGGNGKDKESLTVGGGGWLIDGLRMKIDFVKRKIEMLFPVGDFLLRDDGQSIRHVMKKPYYVAVNGAVAKLVLQLPDPRASIEKTNLESVEDELATMSTVGEALGLGKNVVRKIAQAVAQVWDDMILGHLETVDTGLAKDKGKGKEKAK